MEQGTGIEPAFTAWEAVVLPIYEPCITAHYTKLLCRKQGVFADGGRVKNLPTENGRFVEFMG